MLGDYPMASPERLKKAILAYHEKVGEIPHGVHKSYAIIGKTKLLADDLEKASAIGEPIQDWSPYVSSSPKNLAATT